MDQHEELLLKRQETREEILNLANKIPSKRILYFFGGLFQKGEPRENLTFWLSNYIFLNLSLVVPALLISIAIDEFYTWGRIWLDWTLGVETSVISILASYIVTKKILGEIANYVIEKISSIDDLNDLRNRLTHSFALKSILPYSIVAWLAWDIAIILGISSILHGFVGWGPSFTTITSGILIGISCHYLIWSSQIPYHLDDLEYELNNFMPANSELIIKLTRMFNKYLYIFAFIFAVFTVAASMIKELIVLSFFLVIGWITITTQFLINRSTIKKIVDLARWKTLNQI